MRNLSGFVLGILILKLFPKAVVLVGILFLLTGCAQLGPDLVKAGRTDYNIVLQQTEDEKSILNLVRVRYGDRSRLESVGIGLRSLLGTFFFASHGVEVPADDLAKYSFLLLDQLAALLGRKVEKAGPLLTLPVSAP